MTDMMLDRPNVTNYSPTSANGADSIVLKVILNLDISQMAAPVSQRPRPRPLPLTSRCAIRIL